MLAPQRSVFLQAGCPSCRPTNGVKALKAFQKKTNCNPLAYPTGKCHHTINSELQKLFHLTEGLLRSFKTLEALKRASYGLSSVALKRTGCDVWQLECQASNDTASVQSDHLLHGYMLPVFFDTDQSNSTPLGAEI